jgi:hypothetical protein
MKPLALVTCALLTCNVACSPVESNAEPPPSMARGTFEVKLNPQETDNPEAAAAGLMRMSLDKRYHGSLDATAQGEVLVRGEGKEGRPAPPTKHRPTQHTPVVPPNTLPSSRPTHSRRPAQHTPVVPELPKAISGTSHLTTSTALQKPPCEAPDNRLRDFRGDGKGG